MTVAELVRIYVKQRPYIKLAIEEGIINYSALARLAKRDIDGSEVAIKIALIRLSREIRKDSTENRKRMLSILRNSTLDVKTKISIIISKEPIFYDFILASSKGPSGYVAVVEEKDLGKVKSKNILCVERNLDIIAINSPVEIENTPGVAAFLLLSIGAENINLLHVISTYKDTLLVLREVDTMKAFEILRSVIK